MLLHVLLQKEHKNNNNQKNNRLIPDYEPLFFFARQNCQNCLFMDIQMSDIDKSQFVIIYK